MESKVKGNIGGKIRAFFVSAYTGKWRFLSIGITALILLYHSSFALILAMMIAWPYRFIRFLLSKNKVVDPLRIFVFAAIIVVFYGWAVYFVNSNPDACNEDMRYIAPIILALSGLVGTTFTYFEEHETVPLVSNIGKVSILTLTMVLSLMACITYLTISPWYVRL